MADFNGLTKEQEDELIEKIMQDKPWEGFFNRAWHRFFRNHLLKITLLFYIPVMNKIIPEYSTIIMGILFILAMATEYRTKRIEDKITDRQWVEVAIRGGVIGNPPDVYIISNNYYKWMILINILTNLFFLYDGNNYLFIYLNLFNIFYISFPGANVLFKGDNYHGYMGMMWAIGYTTSSKSVLYKYMLIVFKSLLYLFIVFGFFVCYFPDFMLKSIEMTYYKIILIQFIYVAWFSCEKDICASNIVNLLCAKHNLLNKNPSNNS